MIEKLDQVAGAADVSAQRADGLGERAYLNINPAMHVEVINGAASVASQDAGGVGVIHHHDGAILFRQVAERGQRTDVAIHGKNAVGDEQLASGLVFDRSQLLFGVGRVFVAEDKDLGAREPRPINDAGVVELVRDDEVFFTQNGGDGAGIGGKPRLKNYAGFHILEAGDFLFQLHVDLHGSGNGAHRARTYAVFARGLKRRLAQLGMRGQT